MKLNQIVEPAILPVSNSEIRDHLRVEKDDVDLIDRLAAVANAATHYIETITSRALVTQQWRYTIDYFPLHMRYIEMPRPPLQTVESFTYKLDDGSTQTLLESTDFVVDTRSEPGKIVLLSDADWPTNDLYPVDAITIEYTAGYGNAYDSTPWDLKLAVLQMASHYFMTTEPVLIGATSTEVDFTVRSLVNNYVLRRF